MKDSNIDITFSEKYKIVAEEYEDISVTSLPFSVRVINRFLNNKITTIADLLRSTPALLLTLKGFGKSCLDEVEAFCSGLNSYSFIGSISERAKTKTVISSIFKNHRDEISLGDFSAFDKYELSRADAALLNKYKHAYDILGDELVFDCVCSSNRILPIIDMLEEYQKSSQRYIDIWNLSNSISNSRKHKKAYSYINAFTLNDDERILLKGMCSSDDSNIISMVNTCKIEDSASFLLLKRFLKWCTFNLNKEIDELFTSLYSNERIRTVIQLRCRGQTLEQIGTALGVTRERVRQIESKAKRIFTHLHSRIRIISKISAERNGDTILTPAEIEEYCGSRHISELLFLLQSYESVNYTYDQQLDIFIVGDDSIRSRVQNYIESLPDIVRIGQVEIILSEASEEVDIPYEMLEKAFLDAYRVTGDVYHRCKLSLATIYERVLETHYPDGFKAYDPDEIRHFRNIIASEYGDVGLPENDHALTSRVTSICMLCGRGVYRLKNKDYMPRTLANKIFEYIKNSDNTIFLTNTLFCIFEDELLAIGIDNKYFLQGVLREIYGDKLVFTRDYISKDNNVTSVYSEVVKYIKKFDFPVSKEQIEKAFPGITEIVILLSVGDPNVLNYFGEYLHSSKLNILDDEEDYLFNVVNCLVSDGDAHHGRELYDIICNEKPEILTRNAAMYPFSTFSILEYLLRDKFQFSRPYIAQNGVEIGRPAERLHDLIYSNDKFAVSDISEFGRENRFQIQSILDYINSCNDEFLLVDDNLIMRIDRIGIDATTASQVEDIVINAICETTPIKNLSIWNELPQLNVPWTEWLIYSILYKWGTRVVVATSSNQFKLSVPLVAPYDRFDPTAFKDMDKGDGSETYMADDLSNIDSLLEEIIDINFLESDL